MEILLSKSQNFNQSILSYLNWLPCSKSFHHILVRITNWCIFLHFRYVCNCYCSTDPRFILAKYLTEYSENCKVTPIMESVTRIRSVTASGLTPGLRNSGRDQVVKRRKYLWASLQFAAGDVTLCKWVSNFATLLVLTTFSSKSRSIVWWRSNHCDLVEVRARRGHLLPSSDWLIIETCACHWLKTQ